MNLEQLKKQYEKLGQEITKLEAAPKLWPQDMDVCWYLPINGDIYRCGWLSSSDYCKKALPQGNIFRTEAEAIAERDARAVVVELRNQPGAKKFVLGKYNNALRVDLVDNEVYTDDAWMDLDGGWHSIYFDSEPASQQAVNTIGEPRILKAARWWAMGEV